MHLIAESTLIPIDNSLTSTGIKFLRFADDIIFFCESPSDARKTLALVAATLDKQQRLTLQRHKTKFYSPKDFRKLCRHMIEDRPLNLDEDRILNIIRKYSYGNPYTTISYNEISDEDWRELSGDVISSIVKEYIGKDLSLTQSIKKILPRIKSSLVSKNSELLSSSEIDYIRLRWFYRRLTQIGHPGAVNVSLENIESLTPCLASICTYLASVQAVEQGEWKMIGKKLLELLESDEVEGNEYFRLSILSLFTKNEYINHFSKLAKQYSRSEPFARREILLAAKQNSAFDWLREHKEGYQTMDTWQRIAYIYGCSGLPKDEKKYFLGNLKSKRPFESVLIGWAKNS
ncbi:MAG: hypothetical protein F6J87_29405 [Spirulina sp. SIO3F2]|nr:hypothetical protein [Spirulina sp. SIO3F2]